MVDAETLKRVEKAAAPFLMAAHQAVIDFAFNQKRRSRWMSLSAEREADTLNLTWESTGGKEHAYHVRVVIYEISLYLNQGVTATQVFNKTNIDRGVKVKLQEGDSYIVHCTFYEEDDFEGLFCMMFHVGIPLSPERKALLNKAVNMELNPEVKISNAVDTFFKKTETFEEKYDEGIKRIKAKKLRPKVEKAQIQDLKEQMEQMKEKFGI
jgi:hypothetical protein